MTLGEKIISLRTLHKMSQGDLAEKLNVSRQSVSKWETGASVPELDKLIMMSELFHITMDELVKSDTIPEKNTEETSEPQTTYVSPKNEHNTNHIVGFMLLGFGLLGVVLMLLFSETISLLCLCLAIYGVIFLVAKKHPGIVCGWFTILILSVAMFSIHGAGLMAIMVLCLFWILFFVMTALTIRAIIKGKRNR
ncbi:MAG: helix-turn-helix transcriptional regulator [Agathobacter sp.]|nr:helix-turn-helix transcriptional regulator [Agathobacter sp.]